MTGKKQRAKGFRIFRCDYIIKMLPKWHILFGFVFAYILIYFFHLPLIAGLIIFLASFLIDGDHYMWYVLNKRDLSLRRAYSWFVERGKKWCKLPLSKRKNYKRLIMVFHGVEFWLLLILLSFVHEFFFWIFLGVMFHIILDIFYLTYKNNFFFPNLSKIYVWKTNKNKKEFLK